MAILPATNDKDQTNSKTATKPQPFVTLNSANGFSSIIVLYFQWKATNLKRKFSTMATTCN